MIQLTTALDMGAVAVDYTHVKIISFTLDSENQRIDLALAHGYLDGESNWVRGLTIDQATFKKFSISGPAYGILVAKTSAAAGEVYYDEVARELYEYLQANYAEYAGTIG